MAEHKHGKMDISAQEKTFEVFVKIVAYNAVAILALLIFLALANL